MSTETTPKTITIDGVEYEPRRQETDADRFVVVRTQGAGVHVGRLVTQEGQEVTLADACRVWRWRGARTLSEMANSGIDTAAESTYTRVSEKVAEIKLLTAIELITTTLAVADAIRCAGWSE